MEKYEGIKFRCKMVGHHFPTDERLAELNRWVAVFAELGLAPLHPLGAYGNHSLRIGAESFIITRTGMVPGALLNVEDYCLVERYSDTEKVFTVKGKHEPSSESILHLLIYRRFPGISAVMHGHSLLLNRHAAALGIPVTEKKYPYGTLQLAGSALALLADDTPCIIMKEHGFVAMGETIDRTAKMVLQYYSDLLEILKMK